MMSGMEGREGGNALPQECELRPHHSCFVGHGVRFGARVHTVNLI